MTGPGDHVIVTEWSDVDGAPEAVSGREKQLVASIFRDDDWAKVVWIPDFVLEDGEREEIETVEGSDHLAVGDVMDYSEKAWSFEQWQCDPLHQTYLPKSQVVVFERGRGGVEIETPQAGLDDYMEGGE